MKPLFQPLRLGALEIPNRILMAPMTRCMAGPGHVPTPEIAAYYARRVAAGLIITEGTIVRPDGNGYPDVPGLFTDEQESGWKTVVDAVHAKGGRIFCQLWHVGRVSHPHFLNGNQPVAPSAVPLEGRIKRSKGLYYGTPRALELDEIPGIVDAFANAAGRALSAGFDGVEIHGANGYLIDQFLHVETNRREDDYGGSIEKRVRFALEVVDAVLAKTGEGKTGIRLSPGAYHYQEGATEDAQTYAALLSELDSRSLAYVHTGIFDDSQVFDYLGGTATDFLRRHYHGTVIASGGYTSESASKAIGENRFDGVAIGRPFIANPGYVDRVANGLPLEPYNDRLLRKLE